MIILFQRLIPGQQIAIILHYSTGDYTPSSLLLPWAKILKTTWLIHLSLQSVFFGTTDFDVDRKETNAFKPSDVICIAHVGGLERQV